MPRGITGRASGGSGTKRRQWLRALGVGGVAGLAGCTGRGAQDTTTQGNATDATTQEGPGTTTADGELPTVGGTYNTVTSSPYQTLNPLYNTESGAGTAIEYALDPSYTFQPGSEAFPLHFSLSTDDGEVWVANVRENLQFSDPYGEVTAETYVYQIQQLHQSDWANTADSSSWYREEEAINVEQTGDYEFQIELPRPNQLYPESYDPYMYPIPIGLLEPYVQEQDAQGLQQDEELLELQFTGNLGPYTLDEWNRSSGIVYSRNEDYYMQDAEGVPNAFDNAPYFEGLEINVLQEESSRLAALRTGEADAAAIPPGRVAEFRDVNNVNVNVIPQPYNEVCAYNMRDNGWNAGPGNLFRQKKFRQGLACAVNKQRLVRGIFRGFAEVEYTWQPRWSQWYPGDENLMTFGTGDLYGPEATRSRIRTALENVEYDYRYDGDRLVTPGGEQVTLSLYHSAGQNTEKNFAQFIAQEFRENAGIRVNVNAINGSKFANDYWQQQVPDNPDQYEWSKGAYNAGPRSVTSANPWDMTVVFGLNTYPLNPLTGDVFFLRDSAYNPYGYYPSWNAEELFNRAENATSTEQLQEILAEIFVKISEDQPMGMMAFPSEQIGYNADINGPIESFFNGWNFPTWYFEGQ